MSVHKVVIMQPTWKGMTPILVEMITRGTAECRAEAVSQLMAMAALADERNELVAKENQK